MTPLEEALAAAQELYEEGKFRRVCVSYSTEDLVKEQLISRLCIPVRSFKFQCL